MTRTRALYPLVVFAPVALVLFAVMAYASTALPTSGLVPVPETAPHPWLAGWVRWDATWYMNIAINGYDYRGPGRQSTVAFFPGYPLAVRTVAALGLHTYLAGILVTVAAGAAACCTFFTWLRERLGDEAARAGVWALLLYPFSWFLIGAAYSDALFLLALMAAFVLVERDQPVLAGLAGAVATATRPVGPAVVGGLALVVLAKRMRAADRWQETLRELRLRDFGVLLSVAGVVAYAFYLQAAFGEPLAFVKVQSAPGWAHEPNLSTFFKVEAWQRIRHGTLLESSRHVVQGIVTVGALAAVPAVVKRLGWAYGLYVLAIVGVPAAISTDFVPMGRYSLAAFPVFAVVGHTISRHRVLALLGIPSAALLIYFASSFARWYLVT